MSEDRRKGILSNSEKGMLEIIKSPHDYRSIIQQCEQDLLGLSEDHERMNYLDILLSLANSIEKVKPVVLAMREELIRNIVDRRNNPLADEDRFYSINEVSQKLGCHRSTVYNKHLKNGLRSVNMGKRDKKVKASDLNAYIHSMESK